MANKVVYKDFSKQVISAQKRLLKRGVGVVAQDVVDDIRESIGRTEGEGETYRIYRYGLGGRIHTASGPGNPPVKLTKALYNSIGYDFIATSGVFSVACKIGVMTGDTTTQSDLTAGEMQRSVMSSTFRPYRADHPSMVPYWLEFGSPEGQMKPRPFLTPAMGKAMAKGSVYRKKIREIVTQWSAGRGGSLEASEELLK